jgi:hypothetical protein
MALYSELKSVEEQTSLSPDNISDSEDNRWLSDTVRWSQIPYWRAWKASFKQHWPAILIHLGLLAINILIVTVYASKGSLTSKCDMNPILDQSKYSNNQFPETESNIESKILLERQSHMKHAVLNFNLYTEKMGP